jgi:prepilin-type N-terminal cleavage/methylation domain-containing protein
MRRCHDNAGFSLAEVIFVVVVVGILTSMVTPLFSPGRWRTDSAVQELALTLNAAQRLAVLRQHDLVVTFELDDHRIRLHKDGDNDGIEDPGEEVSVQALPETVGFGLGTAPALPHGAGPVSFASGSGDPRLTFHRNGSASDSGVVYVRPEYGSMAANAEAVRALTVERATGEVRCYSYRTGSWVPSC